MDIFIKDGIISTIKNKLLVQEKFGQEVDDKILMAPKSSCVPKVTVTQVYSLILRLTTKV